MDWKKGKNNPYRKMSPPRFKTKQIEKSKDELIEDLWEAYQKIEKIKKEKEKLEKELAGHNDSSHGGRYKYRIKGLLDKIQHIKPTNASLILKREDYGKAIGLMKKYSTDYVVYDIKVSVSHFVK